MARPSTIRIPVRVTGVAIGLLAVATLAACTGSSSGGGSQPTPTNTTTSTTTVTRGATAPATTSSGTRTSSGHGGSGSSGDDNSGGGNSGDSNSGGGSGSDTGAYCKESQLKAEIEAKPVAGSGEHGRKAVIVDFLNTSNSTCVLYGYPGAAVLDSSGKQVQEGKRTVRGQLLGYAPGHNTLVHVALKPGAVATAGIEGVNQQEQGTAQAGCESRPNPQIEITPPNTKIPVPFDVTWPICYSFTVHPVNYQN